MKRKLKIFITDDFDVVILGLKAILTNLGHEVVGSSKTGQGLIDWLESNSCDIVLLDLGLPDIQGVEILKKYIGVENAPKFLILSDSYDVKQIQETIVAGAAGYITKSESGFELEEAIEKVSLGRRYYTDCVIDAIISKQLEEETFVSLNKILSPEQARALELLSQNMETEDIAKEMKISNSSLRTHFSRMMEKLDIKNKVGLVVLAVKHNFKTKK
ncbi:response regulator transcription factor [Tenacibaculum sp. 190524A05c]|uniref:response regulator transcription factor n=1 Tax=Tenacibaculum platacis TaxID=3137852 RepID=UPI0031FB8B77